MPLEISPQELRAGEASLDRLLEEAFDGAVVLDEHRYIIYNTPKQTRWGFNPRASGRRIRLRPKRLPIPIYRFQGSGDWTARARRHLRSSRRPQVHV